MGYYAGKGASARYRLSQSGTFNPFPPERLDLGKLGAVFIIYGLLGLGTAWFFSGKTDVPIDNVSIYNVSAYTPTYSSKSSEHSVIGPIQVTQKNTVYVIKVYADIPVQHWAFVEGEVLDSEQEYLFSFGKELWHETGRDSDGAWRDNNSYYALKVTFPEAGQFYLRFRTESSKAPDEIRVTVAERRGSSLPHMWFGILSLLIGLVLNELKNTTITRFLNRVDEYS